MNRNEIALKILCALLSNPERYRYIAEQVESGRLSNREATDKNIHKAFKMAEQFIEAMETYDGREYYESMEEDSRWDNIRMTPEPEATLSEPVRKCGVPGCVYGSQEVLHHHESSNSEIVYKSGDEE